MIEYKASAPDEKSLQRLLRAELSKTKPDWRTFWKGFIVGAILLAAMGFGDVWVCVGACDTSSAIRIGQP
jgi:hypothetical protein